MQDDGDRSISKRRLSKNPLLYSSLFIMLVAAYTTWVLLSRHVESRLYQQRIEKERAEKRRQSDQAAMEQLGGSELAIQMLYATPEVRRGESGQLCFGVANAKSVRLEPQAGQVWPSHSLCVDINPTKTTTYTLTATGGDGKTVSQQVTVTVR